MEKIRSAIKDLCDAVDGLPGTNLPLEEMIAKGIDRGKYDATVPIRRNLQKAADLLRIFSQQVAVSTFEEMPQSSSNAVLLDLRKLLDITKELPIRCQLPRTSAVPPNFGGQELMVAHKVDRLYQSLYYHLLPLRAPLIQLQQEAAQNSKVMKDFFISYTQADRAWAEWIAWQLEAAGYSTVIQAWDFRPGANFVLEMQNAAATADRTIAVLSQKYLESSFTASEWAAAFAQDPQGRKQKLIPVRVAPCDLTGILAPIVYLDLVGVPEKDAQAALLGAFRIRNKPSSAPVFPGSPTTQISTDTSTSPVYPGATETTPIAEILPSIAETADQSRRLSAVQRLQLVQQLNEILPQQFNMLLFATNPPAGLIPPMPAPQADRGTALLTWAEAPSGCGLSLIQEVLGAILNPQVGPSQSAAPPAAGPEASAKGASSPLPESLQAAPSPPAATQPFVTIATRLSNHVSGSYLQRCWMQVQQGLLEAESGATFALTLGDGSYQETLDLISNGIKQFALILSADVKQMTLSLASITGRSDSEQILASKEIVRGLLPSVLCGWILVHALRTKDVALLNAAHTLGIDSMAVDSFSLRIPRKETLEDLAQALPRLFDEP